MAFPGSLMGSAVATMGGGNARSLYNMENSDMHMVSSLQLPYQQWSREGRLAVLHTQNSMDNKNTTMCAAAWARIKLGPCGEPRRPRAMGATRQEARQAERPAKG